MRRKPLNVEMMDDAMAEVLRAKSPAARLAIANGEPRASLLLPRLAYGADTAAAVLRNRSATTRSSGPLR